jgi:hypothetical protein
MTWPFKGCVNSVKLKVLMYCIYVDVFLNSLMCNHCDFLGFLIWKLQLYCKCFCIYDIFHIWYWYNNCLRDGLGDRILSPCKVKNFIFSMSSKPALGPTQPPIQWLLRALSPGVKRPGPEANHSLPTRAKVKKMWIYTSIPPYAFM